MRSSGKPRLSQSDQDNLDNLARLGVKVDPVTGETTTDGSLFQGSSELDLDAEPGDTGPDDQNQTDQTPPEPDRLEDESGSALPANAAAPIQETPREPGKQTEEGLAKREADARKAQQELSKTQLKMEGILAKLDRRFNDIDQQVQKLEALQAIVGNATPTLNPADAEIVAQYRDEYSEAVSVMEALVAPCYTALAQAQEQIKQLSTQVGEYFSKQKEDAVFGAIYSKIPKKRVEEITSSQAFYDWLRGMSPTKQRFYVDIFNNTSNYSPEDALDALGDFSRATGIDLGLNNGTVHADPVTPSVPAMDRSPVLRSGGALPEVQERNTRSQSEELRPLSTDEVANFGTLIRNSKTPHEADILTKRLRLTELSFSGSTARTLR